MTVFYQNIEGTFEIFRLLAAGARIYTVSDPAPSFTEVDDLTTDASDIRNWIDPAWRSDDKFLAVSHSSFGDIVDIYKLTTPTELTRLTTDVPTWGGSFKTGLHFSPDNELLLAIGETAPRLELASISEDTFTLISPDPFDVQPGTNQFAGRFSPDSNLIVSGGNNTGGPLRIYERGVSNSFNEITSTALDSQPNNNVGSPLVQRLGIAFSPDGNYLAVSGKKNSTEMFLTVYSISGTNFTTLFSNLLSSGTGGQYSPVIFTNDSQYLYFSHDASPGTGVEPKLQGWSVDSGAFNPIASIGVSLIGNEGQSLSVDATNTYLSTGEYAGGVQVEQINLADGTLATVGTVTAAGSSVKHVAFSRRIPTS